MPIRESCYLDGYKDGFFHGAIVIALSGAVSAIACLIITKRKKKEES